MPANKIKISTTNPEAKKLQHSNSLKVKNEDKV